MQEPGYQPSMNLYVRSLCPRGAHRQQDRIVERLKTMDEAGQIEGFSISIWGDRVPRDGQTAINRTILERIERFEAWSDGAGTSLAPFFQTQESGSMVADETRTTVEVPVVCLAEYHDGTLQYVAPCIDNGTHCTVLDRLDAIEGGDFDVRREQRASR